jgi:hypothetical protein
MLRDKEPLIMSTESLKVRQDRLREIFKQYFNEDDRRIFFWDDEDLEEDLKERLNSTTNRAFFSHHFYFTRFDNIDILTMEFFYGMASQHTYMLVSSLIYGPDFNGERMPFIGSASHLANQGYLWTLAYMMAAKHGFVYKDIDDDIYVYTYHKLFGWVFDEYDDFLRNRLNRRNLYEDLTRWDCRVQNRFDDLMKDGRFESLPEEQQRTYRQIYRNSQEYTFTGADKMGWFFSGLGYISPEDRAPDYTTVFYPGLIGSTQPRRKLDFALAAYAREMVAYIYKKNLKDPDMSRFKFLYLDKKQKALVISTDTITATDEEIYNEIVIVCSCIGKRIPTKEEFDLVVNGGKVSKEEDADNADT